MTKAEYAEKLKDPRWQKRRLEIMQRDEFSCVECGDSTATLHIHHERYSGEPWDAPNNSLKTLCAACHSEEECRKKFENLMALKNNGVNQLVLEWMTALVPLISTHKGLKIVMPEGAILR